MLIMLMFLMRIFGVGLFEYAILVLSIAGGVLSWRLSSAL